MKCFELEEIAAFAMDPAKQENEEMALHIAVCPKCRCDLELALESLNADTRPLPGDEQLAKEATEALFAKKHNWKKFQNFIETTSAKLKEQLKKGMFFLSADQLAKPRQQMSFSAARMQTPSLAAPSFNSLPTITFESDAPEFSEYYWKVQMAFPMMLSESAMITMKVSDKTGKSLRKGTLMFLGKEFPILLGNVTIPFKDFQNNKMCASIGVRFADGCSTPGAIKFLPESFV